MPSHPLLASPDEHWMRAALAQASLAAQRDEVPVGAVLVKNNQLISAQHNSPIISSDCTAHAEINAIREAGKVLGNYRLIDCTLYVTLEPCSMCVGAIVHARVGKLVFGASDYKTGAITNTVNLLELPIHNHKVEVQKGVLESECSKVISDFFSRKRAAKKAVKQASSDL